MTAALRKPMTLGQFLDWEATQPLRYEFDGFRPIAMTGGTGAHSAIQGNLAVSLRGRLRGRPCQFHGSDLKIEVAGRIRYPDGFVVCTPVGNNSTVVRDPVVIFEVLSESTAATDYGAKNEEYAATSSVQRYVILRQNKIAGTMYERIGDDWIWHVLSAASVLRMPEIGIEVPLAEFYIDIDLSPISGDDAMEPEQRTG
jgi:Uma2 family endonuclease